MSKNSRKSVVKEFTPRQVLKRIKPKMLTDQEVIEMNERKNKQSGKIGIIDIPDYAQKQLRKHANLASSVNDIIRTAMKLEAESVILEERANEKKQIVRNLLAFFDLQGVHKTSVLRETAKEKKEKAIELRKKAERLEIQSATGISAVYALFLEKEFCAGKQYSIDGNQIIVQL